MTLARLRGVVPPARTLIVTARDQAAAVRRQLPGIPAANVLVEPVGRNTAPCLALAALEIARRDSEATFVCLPADHAVADVAAFRDVLLEAFAWAAAEPAIVTVGVRPTAPETGYGYLRVGGRVGGRTARVQSFVEKPPLARARGFVRSRRYLWNSGIFVWQAATVLGLLDALLPAVIGPIRRALARPRGQRTAALARAYGRFDAVSIDVGLAERAPDVLVVSGAFGWSDVGTWVALAALGAATGKPVVPVEANRYVVFNPDRLVALVGVDDLIVVDTADALLICHRDRAQDVRHVVRELERRKLRTYT
jgi:mannose-1-phosphate guanylyltransferase